MQSIQKVRTIVLSINGSNHLGLPVVPLIRSQGGDQPAAGWALVGAVRTVGLEAAGDRRRVNRED